jgi:hypothetical protein
VQSVHPKPSSGYKRLATSPLTLFTYLTTLGGQSHPILQRQIWHPKSNWGSNGSWVEWIAHMKILAVKGHDIR